MPHVAAAKALVVHPVGYAVDRHFSYVGVEVLFRVPGPGCVGVNEEKQDALERPALGVHPQVEVGVRASCDGNHLFAHDEVVANSLPLAYVLIASSARSLLLITSYSHMDVFQLVPELGAI